MTTVDDVLQELNVLETNFAAILDDRGKRALKVAIDALTEQKETMLAPVVGRGQKARDRALRGRWSLQIPPGDPLSFVATDISAAVRHRVRVDLFCDLTRIVDGAPEGGEDHNIAVRVWTEDEALLFREHLDAASLHDVLRANRRRVMLRFHFDFANPGQPGPRCHLQIGGTQHHNEYCWLPENWKLPRFAHYPMGLIQACELIALTFFPQHYERIAREHTWKRAITAAQEAYLRPYLDSLPMVSAASLRPDGFRDSLLYSLWNR